MITKREEKALIRHHMSKENKNQQAVVRPKIMKAIVINATFCAQIEKLHMLKTKKHIEETPVTTMPASNTETIKAVYITLKVDVIHQANKGAKYQQQGKDGEKQS